MSLSFPQSEDPPLDPCVPASTVRSFHPAHVSYPALDQRPFLASRKDCADRQENDPPEDLQPVESYQKAFVDTAVRDGTDLRRSLLELPEHVLHEIFSFLDANDLGRISCCCRLFLSIASESAGWQRFYCERWRLPPQALLYREISTSTSSGAPSSHGDPESSARAVMAAFNSKKTRESPLIQQLCRSPSQCSKEFSNSRSLLTPSESSCGKGRICIKPGSWRDLYLRKERRSAALLGRYESDWVSGHTAGVKSVAILPHAPLAVSAGYDSTVRIWDLDSMAPLAASGPLGETIRAIAADWEFLALGGTDCRVRLWPLARGCPHFFDVDGLWEDEPSRDDSAMGRGIPSAPFSLLGHTGPISCMSASQGCRAHLFTGSWDKSVICWDVGEVLECRHVAIGETTAESEGESPNSTIKQRYLHRDWVWAAVARSGTLFSTAGTSQYTWDAETAALLRQRDHVHERKATAVQGSLSGRFAFTAGEDGMVKMFDERLRGKERRRAAGSVCPEGREEEPVASWIGHGGAVNSLAFEDPWLVSASTGGCCTAMDVGKVMQAGQRHPPRGSWATSAGSARRFGGNSGSLLCLDVGHERVVCGSTETLVRVFDFRRASGAPRDKRRNGRGAGRK